MNTQSAPHARSPWHPSTWTDYVAHLMHPQAKQQVRMTRRQELLAAQDKRRQEQRDHVLELLREVRDKHRAEAHIK